MPVDSTSASLPVNAMPGCNGIRPIATVLGLLSPVGSVVVVAASEQWPPLIDPSHMRSPAPPASESTNDGQGSLSKSRSANTSLRCGATPAGVMSVNVEVDPVVWIAITHDLRVAPLPVGTDTTTSVALAS